MYKFSDRSLERLLTCHVDLQKICNIAIQHWDITIVCGFRDKEAQNRAFEEGFSKVVFPNGKHNTFPSNAVDVAPWEKSIKGIPWNDIDSFKRLGYFMLGIAAGKGIKLRWGADWNKNYDTEDERWNDWPHYELVL